MTISITIDEVNLPNLTGLLDGRIEEKVATAQWQVEPGDIFAIETPGGGGFGAV